MCVCVWGSRRLLATQSLRGLVAPESWHLGWEGQCGEGHQETTQSTSDSGILPGSISRLCSATWQNKVFLLTSWGPSGARK